MGRELDVYSFLARTPPTTGAIATPDDRRTKGENRVGRAGFYYGNGAVGATPFISGWKDTAAG
jgi:hypothetical protein